MPEASKFIKKEALAQVFSCEFWEISKNTFFHRTPPVAAFSKFIAHIVKKITHWKKVIQSFGTSHKVQNFNLFFYKSLSVKTN